MHRIKILVLVAIVAAMMLYLYFIGNDSIVKPISYSGSIRIIERNNPTNNIRGLKFPFSEEKKYIYVFIIDKDKLDYKRYDIESGKAIDINVPINKKFYICTEIDYSNENSWRWYSDLTNSELKGKVAKYALEEEIKNYTSLLGELKGKQYSQKCFLFSSESIGTEKICLVYGNSAKDYIKVLININVGHIQ